MGLFDPCHAVMGRPIPPPPHLEPKLAPGSYDSRSVLPMCQEEDKINSCATVDLQPRGLAAVELHSSLSIMQCAPVHFFIKWKLLALRF